MILAPRVAVSALALAAVGCASRCPEPRCAPCAEVKGATGDPLDRGGEAATGVPGLREKMSASAFAYFRGTNRVFNDTVCAEWQEAHQASPVVGLHGDAHVEQYAVASDGRGLADFDEAAFGPAIVDLARFATSLHLAARTRADGDAAVAAFLDGYMAALADPEATAPEPAVAKRTRDAFAPSVSTWLARVEAMIQPPAAAPEGEEEQRALAEYALKMQRFRPDLPAGFFTMKRGGKIALGIGSARQKKYLVRIEGPTASPDDDVMMEAKEASAEPLGRCLQSTGSAALRSVVGEARFGGGPERLLGVAKIHGRRYSSHAWRPHYREIGVEDLRTGAELAELARDVGVQLGRHHPVLLSGPFAEALREELSDLATRVRPTLSPRSAALAERVRAAWARFRASPSAP